MKILVTGFEPFGGDPVNASWEAVTRLPDRVGGAELVKKLLPVSYDRVSECLRALIDACAPAAVLCVGQAAGRTAVTPEKVAINWKAGSIPDNDGVRYDGEEIRPGGETAFFATIPVERIAGALREEGIPASVSYTAGTYICNGTMYALLDILSGTPVRGGFIHVPYTCAQAAQKPGIPSLPLEMIVRGLEKAIRIIAE